MTARRTNKKVGIEIFDDREIPQNDVAEQIVLGTILIEPRCLDAFSGDFSEELFWSAKNKKIAKAINQLYLDSKPIDMITVCDYLRKNNDLQAVGVQYVSTLTTRIASSANFDVHFRIIQEMSLRRHLIQHCTSTLSKTWSDDSDVFDVFNEAQNGLESALKKVITYDVQKVGEVHEEIVKESISVVHTGKKSGVPTGFRMLDNVTNGFQRSDLIILAGRPSMGKTACALSMIINPAIHDEIPVAIFSLEMSKQQLTSRLQSSLSEVNVSKIVKKQLTLHEIEVIDASCQKLKTAPIYIDDTPSITMLDLKGKSRKLVKEKNVSLIIVDYLQLMRSGIKTNSREQEIAEISRGLKSLAKELNIPIIALSQLSRNVEQRGGDKKPMLQDLRESGQIEQDADMVMFCYRPEYYGLTDYDAGGNSFDTHGLFMLIVAKHRNGELGEIPLKFIHDQAKVTNHSFSSSLANNGNNVTASATTNNVVNKAPSIFENPNKDVTFVQRSEVKLSPNTSFDKSSEEDLFGASPNMDEIPF